MVQGLDKTKPYEGSGNSKYGPFCMQSRYCAKCNEYGKTLPF